MPLRRKFIEAIAIGLVLGSSLVHAAEAKKPNIVLLVADDLGYTDLGFTGARDIPTPNLNALAAVGVTLTNGYVSGPYCSPTCAGLLTGRYQQRFGHESNPGGQAETGLPLGETTIADRLKAAGYATGLVGKWHLGSTPQFHPRSGASTSSSDSSGASTPTSLARAAISTAGVRSSANRSTSPTRSPASRSRSSTATRNIRSPWRLHSTPSTRRWMRPMGCWIDSRRSPTRRARGPVWSR